MKKNVRYISKSVPLPQREWIQQLDEYVDTIEAGLASLKDFLSRPQTKMVYRKLKPSDPRYNSKEAMQATAAHMLNQMGSRFIRESLKKAPPTSSWVGQLKPGKWSISNFT